MGGHVGMVSNDDASATTRAGSRVRWSLELASMNIRLPIATIFGGSKSMSTAMFHILFRF